jgi:hypothetical protein
MQQHRTAGAEITFRQKQAYYRYMQKVLGVELIESKKQQFFSPFLATKYAK